MNRPARVKGWAYVAVLLLLVLVVGAGNLLATYMEVQNFKQQQQVQGQQTQQKLCTTLGKLSALKPPAGNASANPSRVYEQQLHEVLAGLGPDIGCPKHH
jgi:uncharacterized protein HemX